MQILSSLRGPVFSLLTAFKGSHLTQGKTHHPSVHRPTVPPSATGPAPSSLPPLRLCSSHWAFSLLLRQGTLILTSGPLHVLFLVLECLSLGFRTTASSSVIQMRGKRGKVRCPLQHTSYLMAFVAAQSNLNLTDWLPHLLSVPPLPGIALHPQSPAQCLTHNRDLTDDR